MLARTNHLDWVPTEQRKGKKELEEKEAGIFFTTTRNANSFIVKSDYYH